MYIFDIPGFGTEKVPAGRFNATETKTELKLFLTNTYNADGTHLNFDVISITQTRLKMFLSNI